VKLATGFQRPTVDDDRQGVRWPDREDLDLLEAHARAAARLDNEGDDDDWCTPTTTDQAAVWNARIVATINAGIPGAPRMDPDPERARRAGELHARAFTALAGNERVRGVVVQLVSCPRRGPRVRVRAWLDTGALVTIERDEEDESDVADAIVVAVESATMWSGAHGSTTGGGVP
jgi:hypothetical protein